MVREQEGCPVEQPKGNPLAEQYRNIVPHTPTSIDYKPLDWEIVVAGLLLEILDRLDKIEQRFKWELKGEL